MNRRLEGPDASASLFTTNLGSYDPAGLVGRATLVDVDVERRVTDSRVADGQASATSACVH